MLLDYVPDDEDLPDEIWAAIETGTDQVTDLHVWQLGPGHHGAIVAIRSQEPLEPAAGASCAMTDTGISSKAGLTQNPAGHASRPEYPSLAEATRTWARIALLSFGGPAGQVAVMHRILVEEKRWIGYGWFLHALNFGMLLPGSEAQQLANYIGWLMHGTRGALIGGALFVLPGMVAIMALSWLYALFGDVGLVEALSSASRPPSWPLCSKRWFASAAAP